MNYCAECGYKLEGDFKYCPNCGSQVNALSNSFKKNDQVKEVITCKNCGEENSVESTNCFSCGVPLKGMRNKNQTSKNVRGKNSTQNEVNGTKSSTSGNMNPNEKILDNKKILIISSFIVVIFIVALLISGVFDSGIQNNITQMNNQSTGTEVDLQNLNEITDLENKIKANPDDMESTLHLAHLQQDSRLFEKAIVNYKKYLERNPANADARVDMAICFYNLGDNSTAIIEMENALKYQPKHQIACLNLGIVNLAAQNIEVSKEWFRKTVELNPESEAGKRAQELLKSH